MEFLSTERIGGNELYTKAEKIQALCRDHIIPNAGLNLRMDNTGNLNFGNHSMRASEWALSQLGTKLGMPSHYLDKCIDAGMPWLAAENANAWLERRPTATFMLREYDGTVRGILSNKYTAFDAPEILERTFDVLDEDDWNVKGSFLNEERMHIRLVGNEDIAVENNDPMFPAVFIDSSDVGRCALSVKFGIWRQVCTNGLIIPAVMVRFRQRHVGIDPYKIVASLRELLTKVPDMVDNASALIKLAETQKLPTHMITEEEFDGLVKIVRANNTMTEADAREVILMAQANQPETRWGLINAMTEFAQTKSIDLRVEIERAAGMLLAA